jgi:hypothetical protein
MAAEGRFINGLGPWFAVVFDSLDTLFACFMQWFWCACGALQAVLPK